MTAKIFTHLGSERPVLGREGLAIVICHFGRLEWRSARRSAASLSPKIHLNLKASGKIFGFVRCAQCTEYTASHSDLRLHGQWAADFGSEILDQSPPRGAHMLDVHSKRQYAT